jgi:CheY-like chemotaxis protein
MEDQLTNPALEMKALICCEDTQFLGTTVRVLNDLGVATEVVADYGKAIVTLYSQRVDAVVADWAQIPNRGEFFQAVAQTKRREACIVAAIVRDLLDLRQAFAAGVHFMFHKPASVVQIAGCCRAVHSAIFARRRRSHREPAQIPASFSGKNLRLATGTILNLSEAGARLKVNGMAGLIIPLLTAGDAVDVNFTLPGTKSSIHGNGEVAWTNPEGEFGVRFQFIPETERALLEKWLTARLENSLREVRERYAVACA